MVRSSPTIGPQDRVDVCDHDGLFDGGVVMGPVSGHAWVAVGSESLRAAVAIVRALDAGTRPTGTRQGIEPTDPCGFVPAAWRPFLIENGKVDRRIWEIALGAGDSPTRWRSRAGCASDAIP